MQLAEKVVHGWLTEDVRDRGSWLTEPVICVCACVCFAAAPNEISRQAESFSSSVQQRLKVRLADSADAFYSPVPAPSWWGVTATAHQPLHSFPHPFIVCTHSHPSIITLVLPGRGVHLRVKLAGGRHGVMVSAGVPGYPCWRAAGRWIG